MADELRELLTWFPTGTAEGERSIAEQTFVYVSQFEQVLSPPEGSPRILVGRKGSGKSAVIDFAQRLLAKQGVPTILLKPKDFDTTGIEAEDTVGALRRRFGELLIIAIVGRLALDVPNFATGDDAAIYHAAIEARKISPDIAGRFARFLPGLAKPIVNADLSSVFPNLTSTTRSELDEAVGRSLKGKRFYVFVDDTDQVASPGLPGHLNRIWGLILAARDLTEEIPEIKIVVTLRSEVWERLKRDDSGQRDQTDHFVNLCVELSSDAAQINRIVERRLELASDAIGRHGELYAPFFDGLGAKPPMSEKFTSWSDLILVRSRERPRDAIQLINRLADAAIKKKIDKIDEPTFQNVMPLFSGDRVELFSQEVEQECRPARDIVDSFALAKFQDGSFVMSADEAKAHFKSVMSRFSVTLFGRTLQQKSDDDAFSLWRFFYNAHVVKARISDKSQKDGYRHGRPENDPMLVIKSRWNEIQAMLWEINPAFRDHLIAKKTQEELRTGLPTRPPKRFKR